MRAPSSALLLAMLIGQALVPAVGHAGAPPQEDAATVEDLLDGLTWRSIGPAFMGGRTVDLAGVQGRPNVLYMATASGGLWRTMDRGITWKKVLYIDPTTGVPDRSNDGGDTWTHVGLETTECIARIRSCASRQPRSRLRRRHGTRLGSP